jgi:hypothetical protein
MDIKKREPIIFIIAGKANAGKDTTADIIDNYAMLKELKAVNLQFSSYIKMYAKVISGWNGEEETKPRSLLQELGTEVIRNKIDNNFFINRIVGDIEVYSYYADLITISDARLPEELDTIAKEFKNVYKLKINRPNFNNHLTTDEKHHRTETALDNYNNYDYIIENDGTIEDLSIKVNEIVEKIIITSKK